MPLPGSFRIEMPVWRTASIGSPAILNTVEVHISTAGSLGASFNARAASIFARARVSGSSTPLKTIDSRRLWDVIAFANAYSGAIASARSQASTEAA